jgi:sirohydrochlorin ferrochelatase
MIGKNWMKALAVTGAAVAVVLPLISSASTHYTGKMPAGIAMMATSTPAAVKKVSSHHKARKVVHHAVVKKAVLTRKGKAALHKKHVALTAKKKRTI